MLIRFVKKHVVEMSEQSIVLKMADGVATVEGLPNVLAGELVLINDTIQGLALNIEQRCVKIVVFAGEAAVQQGDTVLRTESIVSVPTGMNLLGRVVDALGNPIDDGIDIEADEFEEVDIKAPGIITRKSVHEPLQSGITAIDAMIPVGRG